MYLVVLSQVHKGPSRGIGVKLSLLVEIFEISISLVIDGLIDTIGMCIACSGEKDRADSQLELLRGHKSVHLNWQEDSQ